MGGIDARSETVEPCKENVRMSYDRESERNIHRSERKHKVASCSFLYLLWDEAPEVNAMRYP